MEVKTMGTARLAPQPGGEGRFYEQAKTGRKDKGVKWREMAKTDRWNRFPSFDRRAKGFLP
jgi:hypothetical protein